MEASKYDHKKKIERQMRLRRVDVSLWSATIVKSEKTCNCSRCNGRHMLTWKSINRNIWKDNAACMYRVMLHIIRINLLKNIRTPVNILQELKELT